jgi:hypothetical protein
MLKEERTLPMKKYLIPILILLASCEQRELAPRAPQVLNTDGSPADVQAKVNSAVDGDMVILPAGTFTWTTGVNVSKGITIQGQTTVTGGYATWHGQPSGFAPPVSDKTILVDNIGGGNRFFNCTALPGQNLRITGITFKGGTGTGPNGPISVGGSTNPSTGGSRSVRFDHLHMTGQLHRGSGIEVYSGIRGVTDHVVADQADKSNPQNFQNKIKNGSFPNGDIEWSQSAGYGGDDFWFVEDCWLNNDTGANFSATQGFDGHRGAKFVIRYNVLFNTEILCHGTEGDRERGGRAQEIYNNEYHWEHAVGNMDGVRSGGLIVHDNTLIGIKPTGGWNQQTYRLIYNYGGPWKGANGTSGWDVNDSTGVYDSGSVTGWTNNGGNGTLTDSSKSWPANKWDGYSLRRTTDGATFLILGNNATSLTTYQWGDPCCIQNFSNGQAYEIRKVLQCIDQPGAGAGDLLSGDNPTPKWLNQPREGNYSWNNIHTASGAHVNFASSSPNVIAGRDYFQDTPKPGYTPYTYPHPLVVGGGTPAPTQAPSASPTPAPSAIPTVTATATPPPVVGVPAAPTDLAVAQVDARNVRLTWADNSNNETGFNIQVNTDNSGWIPYETTAANVTTRTLGMSPNKHYDFRVSATNATGTSAFTNVAGIDFGAATPAPTATATATPPTPTATATPATPTPTARPTASPSPQPTVTPVQITIQPGEIVIITAPKP